MSYDIRYSDTFKRGVKALVKKYPLLKQDLANFVRELAENPHMRDPIGKDMFNIGSSGKSTPGFSSIV
jgi:mRNA-degrading endonuclease YafQ of YafQ-DinJ toxin-antitoxin module